VGLRGQDAAPAAASAAAASARPLKDALTVPAKAK
jgi:hypothetical protein